MNTLLNSVIERINTATTEGKNSTWISYNSNTEREYINTELRKLGYMVRHEWLPGRKPKLRVKRLQYVEGELRPNEPQIGLKF